MSQENVVPFETTVRRAMARRGSPDKARSFETAEVLCPYCGAVLCLDVGLLARDPEVLCDGCRTVIDLGNPGTVDARR